MKTLTPLILLSLVGSMIAADCTAHPMKNTFSFITQATASATSGANYCKSIKGINNCCTTAILNDIPNQITTVTNSLAAKAALRDKYLLLSRDTTVAGVSTKIATLKTAAADAITAGKLAAGTTDANADTTKNSGALTLVTNLGEVAKQLTDGLAALKTGYSTMQKARVTCMNALLKVQASAYCLACNPGYDTVTFTGSGATASFVLSDAVKTRIRNACFAYVQASDAQTPIFLGAALSTKLDDINTALVAIKAAAAPGKENLKTAVAAAKLYSADLTSEKRPVTIPAACVSTACALLDTWFVNSKLVEDLIVAGGDIDDTLVSSGTTIDRTPTRLLEQGRVLIGEYDFDDDESGVAPNFPEDPSNPTDTDASGAELMKSGLISLIVVMLGAFLI